MKRVVWKSTHAQVERKTMILRAPKRGAGVDEVEGGVSDDEEEEEEEEMVTGGATGRRVFSRRSAANATRRSFDGQMRCHCVSVAGSW